MLWRVRGNYSHTSLVDVEIWQLFLEDNLTIYMETYSFDLAILILGVSAMDILTVQTHNSVHCSSVIIVKSWKQQNGMHLLQTELCPQFSPEP